MENASNIEIIGCKIHSTAASGIWLNYAVDSVTIKGNWFEDIGYCGIFAYGFWPGAPESYVQGPNTTAMDTYINRNHTIDSNVIRNVGMFAPRRPSAYIQKSLRVSSQSEYQCVQVQ